MKVTKRSRWSSASLAALCLVTPPAQALAPRGSAAEARETLEAAVLDVTVNGVPGGEPVLFLKGQSGRLYAPAEALTRWRMRPSGKSFLHEGITYFPISGIPGLGIELAEATQTLELRADPALLESNALSYRAPDAGPMTQSAVGGFLNYDLLAQVSGGDVALSGAVEIGVFTPQGAGVGSFVGQWNGSGTDLTRLDASWTVDDPARLRSIRIGDGISRGGVGGAPLRFGGIQLARNFEVDPGFVTLPLPSLGGSAAVPSVVDIYVNNVLAGRREVPPGPFEISGIPVVTGGGEVQLLVRDLLGREVLVSQSYYTSRRLLRQGLHDYSYEIGFLRRNFGRKSNEYGGLVFSGTHRYGLTDDVAVEAHVEATADVQAGGAGASVAFPGFGMLEASIAFSRSAGGEGHQIGVGFERRAPHLAFGILAELTNGDYVSVGSPPGRPPAAASVQLFAGLPLRFGSLGLSYLWRNARGGEPDVQLLGMNASFRLGRFGSLHLAARQSFAEGRSSAVELMLVVPLGARTSASAGARLGRDGGSLNAGVQKNLPSGPGFGYRAGATLGEVDRLDGRVAAQTGSGTYSAEVSWVDGRTGVRASAAGGIGAVGDHLFVSRQLTQSFATVQVGDYAGVKVYADNQLVGVTNASGRAVIPRLRPFDGNAIRIEATDLPLDAEIPRDSQMVRPYGRSGVSIDFGVRRSRGAILVLRLEDGGTVPAGSTVRLEGRADAFVAAQGGEVYLTGLERDNLALATWTGGQCRVRFAFIAGKDPQPNLGEILCRAVRG